MKNKKIILITEDDGSLRGALDDKLLNSGFDVLEAQNGEEGLVISLKEHPDLILLDLAMPKMDGMSMLRALRKDEWGKTVPVIIMTNLSSEDEKINKDITELEPTYYLTKSNVGINNIIEKIKERLGIL
jgi:twitching motility two-component system response regulator PilH